MSGTADDARRLLSELKSRLIPPSEPTSGKCTWIRAPMKDEDGVIVNTCGRKNTTSRSERHHTVPIAVADVSQQSDVVGVDANPPEDGLAGLCKENIVVFFS